ncbi:pilus assembly PilX family protein [Thiocapsa bogorovii]|uniref:pilus assembly PilX family protein n=1 Tax=Thiocapsa bogorovii TaxID=521689 RepID=UPI001E42CEC4|nr:PilX N-terminal domain-containing pilus assembly protein [Thiocapsa bogorovii]UHD17897.1 PilX N-terminal domain-containing pilus assembly protein [Thiocapsa bogorovii]
MIRSRRPNSDRNRWPRQKGVVLVVALMFMLVMTVVGITAMRSTILQERMAGNVRDRELAFQAAEAALRAGELAVLNDTSIAATKDLEAALDELGLDPDPAQWGGTNPESTGTAENLGLPSAPVFYVDPVRKMNRIGVTLPPRWQYGYQVTARGVGGTDKAVVILQSVVEPP